MVEEFELAVLIYLLGITIRVATFGSNRSVTDSKQTIYCCFNPEVFWFYSLRIV